MNAGLSWPLVDIWLHLFAARALRKPPPLLMHACKHVSITAAAAARTSKHCSTSLRRRPLRRIALELLVLAQHSVVQPVILTANCKLGHRVGFAPVLAE